MSLLSSHFQALPTLPTFVTVKIMSLLSSPFQPSFFRTSNLRYWRHCFLHTCNLRYSKNNVTAFFVSASFHFQALTSYNLHYGKHDATSLLPSHFHPFHPSLHRPFYNYLCYNTFLWEKILELIYTIYIALFTLTIDSFKLCPRERYADPYPPPPPNLFQRWSKLKKDAPCSKMCFKKKLTSKIT